MRLNWLKTPNLILSLSKDEAEMSCFFSSLSGLCCVVAASEAAI